MHNNQRGACNNISASMEASQEYIHDLIQLPLQRPVHWHAASLRLNKSFRGPNRLPNLSSKSIILKSIFNPFFLTFYEKNKSRSRCLTTCWLPNLCLKIILSESKCWIINSIFVFQRKISLDLGVRLHDVVECHYSDIVITR